jgi:tripartite-type tricarboxylate transporter receptor subunit TctC
MTGFSRHEEEEAMFRFDCLAKPASLGACGLLLAAGTAAFAAPAPAGYPTKPIRMLVGFAPGGGTDITARAIATRLTTALGHQVIVDNRAGAAGNIATEIVAKASPDGYTLLMGTIAALAINVSLYDKLPFDPVNDFAPITQAVSSTNILVVHPTVDARSVKDLVALSKKKAGALNYGSSGVGGAGHLAGELFNKLAKTSIAHIPYKGGSPVMLDLLSGQVQVVFATAATALPHIKADRIRALGVTTAKRAGMVPDIPTIAEQGLPGYDANNWYGVLAPAGTPAPIVAKLNQEITTVLKQPDLRDLLFTQGLDPAPSTPDAFGAYIRAEIRKWAPIVREAGARSN